MKTFQAVLAEEISRVLDGGVDAVDAGTARELMAIARWEHRHACDNFLTFGPLKSLAEVTSEVVHAHLLRLLAVRWAVYVRDTSDAAATLMVLLNVLLAEDAAIRVKWRYTDTARSAMMAAIIANRRGEQHGVDAARDMLTGVAREALNALKSGGELEDVAPEVSASQLICAELKSRLRGEIATTVWDVSNLRFAVHYLVDVDPHDLMPLRPYRVGPGVLIESLYEIREGVVNRLSELYNARRGLFRERPWPQTATESGEQLALLFLVVLAGDAATSIARTYAAAEAQAVALTAVALLRGDAEGIAAQEEALRAAAATALHQSGDPTAPVDPKMVEGLLHAQLA